MGFIERPHHTAQTRIASHRAVMSVVGAFVTMASSDNIPLPRPNDYFRTLDDFLQAGADSDATMRLHYEFSTRMKLARRSPGRDGFSSLMNYILYGLESWKQCKMQQGTGRFVTEVTPRIHVHEKIPRSHADRLISVFLNTFGEYVAMPLLQAVEQRRMRHDRQTDKKTRRRLT